MATQYSSFSTAPFYFSGAPNRLKLFNSALAGQESCKIILPDSLKSFAGNSELMVPVLSHRDFQEHIRIRLPKSTPPGAYEAELEINGAKHPITIQVDPLERLSVRPLNGVFEGKPGAKASFEVTLSNVGNTDILIPDTGALGVYDDKGLENAFASTYRQDTDKPEKLLSHWMLKLREGYGGLLKLRISGSGVLQPQAQRTLTLETNIPEKMKPGHSYHGVWRLSILHYPIRVRISR